MEQGGFQKSQIAFIIMDRIGCRAIFFDSLSDKYGCRLPLIVTMCLFLLATLGCLYSWTIMQFVGWRVVQGIADTRGIVISRSIAANKYSGRELAKMLAVIGAIIHNRWYVCYILQFGFAQGVLFVNIASSPFIMQQHYGFSPLMVQHLFWGYRHSHCHFCDFGCQVCPFGTSLI